MSDWKTMKLGDIIETNISNYTSKDAWEFVNYLDTSNITEGNIQEIQKLFLGEDKIPSRAKRKVAEGDIIYSTVRPNQRHYGIIKRPPKNLLVSTGFTTIRAKGEADSSFIYWFLTQDSIVNFLQGIGENSTSTYPSIKSSDIEALSITLPPLPEQKAIAHILGKLDDKIELNRKMNQTLEAMAQALFKSWFVDFDPVMDNALASGTKIPEALKAKAEKRQLVPDSKKLRDTNPELAKLFPSAFEFNETLGKWIPEGWEVKSLDHVITLIGGGTPKTTIEEYWNGNIPWFSVVDAPTETDVFVIDTEKKVTKSGVDNSSTKILPEWTTIISARGTVGKCALVGVPMAMNQSCYGIKSNSRDQDIFTYLLIRKNVADLQNKSHGSVFSTITASTFKSINVALPSDSTIQQKFENYQLPSFLKIKSNLFESNTLTQLRDTLLPQLISGKVRVPIRITENQILTENLKLK